MPLVARFHRSSGELEAGINRYRNRDDGRSLETATELTKLMGSPGAGAFPRALGATAKGVVVTSQSLVLAKLEDSAKIWVFPATYTSSNVGGFGTLPSFGGQFWTLRVATVSFRRE